MKAALFLSFYVHFREIDDMNSVPELAFAVSYITFCTELKPTLQWNTIITDSITTDLEYYEQICIVTLKSVIMGFYCINLDSASD